MAAPEYVPNTLAQQPRRGLGLPPARSWIAARPGELRVGEQPHGDSLGDQGPDQGYGLALARRFADRLVLDGVTTEDALAGCVGIGLKRASLFGRAPIIHDMDLALRVWGFLGDAPPELVELRRPLFQAAAHHYWDQRAIADRIPEATLRLGHAEVASRFPADWRALLGLHVEGET